MPRVQESIHIDRPVSDVFAFVTDPDNQTTIQSNLISFESDGPLEKGRRASGATRVAGKKVEWTSEVTEYHLNDRVEMRSVDAPMEFVLTWLYEEEDGGTRLSFIQEVPNIGGFFGKLGDAVVTKMYARDVKSNLENLKTLLEEA